MGAELAAGAQPLEASMTKPAGPLALPPPKFKVEPGVSLARPTKNLPSSSLAHSASPLLSSASTSTLPAPPVATAEAEDPYAGLSARERNKMKRQRKNEAKGGGSSSSFAPPAKVRVVEAAPVAGPSGSSGPSATAVPVTEGGSTGVKGEVVIIDPGAKAREGGEVKVEEGDTKEKAAMEVQVGEWPWRGTVERLAVGLLS